MGRGEATTPFLGRDGDLARLTEALNFGGDGGGIVVLSGPAGIGKTRAVRHLAEAAQRRGARPAVGHCVGQAGVAMPYLPFTELLTDVEVRAPETFTATLDRHPVLARLLLGNVHGPDPPNSWQTADPGPIAEAVHAALTAAGREAPLLVVIEDAHWADHSTRDLLTVLMTRGFTAPVSMVVTYRSDDLSRNHPLHETLALWARLDAVERIELGPLDDAVIRQLVLAMGAPPGDHARIADVVTRAEGNPFFAEELCAACDAPLSENLTRVLLARYEGLDARARRVLRVVAAHGRRIGDELLSRVAGLGPAELDESLREAIDAGVLTVERSGSYAFRHALLAEAIGEELLPGERTRLHREFVSVITADRSLATPAELERHAAAAGDTAAAIDAAIGAGRSSYAMGGPRDALDHYERALGWMDGDAPERDSVALEAARAAHASGEVDRAIEILSDRIANPGKDSTDDRRARLLAALSRQERFSTSGSGARDHAELAYALVSREPTPTRLEVLIAYLEQLIDRRELSAAAPIGEEARALAIRLGLDDAEIELRSVIARSMFRVGDVEGVENHLRRAIADGGAADPSVQVLVRLQLASVERQRCRPESTRALLDEAIAIGRATGRWGVWETLARTEGATVAYELGDFDGALARLELPATLGPHPAARATLGATALVVRAARDGRVPEAELADLRHWWGHDAYIALLSMSAGIDGLGFAGDVEGAVALMAEGLTVLDAAWGEDHEAVVRLSALLAGVAADAIPAADGPTARRWLATVQGHVDRANAVVGALGSPGVETRAWLSRANADMLRLRWRAGESLGHAELEAAWREAVAGFEEYHHEFEVARCRLRLAEVVRAAGDRAAAQELDDAVRTAAEALPSAPLLRAVERAAQGSTPPPESRPTAAAGGAPVPTAREMEVLRLLARGRSNGQIAAQLFIAVKTASVHVTNLMAKLGASSRGEAVAIARDRGLLD